MHQTVHARFETKSFAERGLAGGCVAVASATIPFEATVGDQMHMCAVLAFTAAAAAAAGPGERPHLFLVEGGGGIREGRGSPDRWGVVEAAAVEA